MKEFLLKIFNAYRYSGTRPEYTRTENVVLSNSNLTYGLSWLTVTSYVPIDIFARDWSMMILHLLTGSCYIFGFFMIRRGYINFGRAWGFFIASTTVVFNVDALGKDALTQYYFLIATVQPFLCFTRKDAKVMLFCVSLGAMGWLYAHILPDHILIPPALHPEYYTRWAPILATPIFIIFVFYQSFLLFYELIQRTEKQGVELVNASRMAAVGEMAGGVAHEINNPLAIISMSISTAGHLLEQEAPNKDLIKTRLATAERTVTRISKITQGLLIYSRGEYSQGEHVSPKEVTDLVVSLSGEKFKSNGVELRVDVADEPAGVAMNMTELSQDLLNLLNNAIDAIEERPEKWVALKGARDGDLYRFDVMDCGTGIPDAIAERIMDPFYTTKPVGKGTGLGLSISKGLIEKRNGKLAYRLADGHTCFSVELPLAQREAQVG